VPRPDDELPGPAGTLTCDAVVRRLRADDLEGLLGLYRHLYDVDLPEVAPGARAAVWDQILHDDAQYYLGAFVGERLVASAFVTIVPNVGRGGRPFAVIENVVTDRAHQRHGHGRAVMKGLVEHAFGVGCYKVMLQSSIVRDGAHAFYESLGFRGDTKRAFVLRAPGL